MNTLDQMKDDIIAANMNQVEKLLDRDDVVVTRADIDTTCTNFIAINIWIEGKK